MLKRNEPSIALNIELKIPQKKSLADQYDLVCALAQDYDQVLWVLDMDVIRRETIQGRRGSQPAIQRFLEFRQQLQKRFSHVSVVVNNPCVEYWFLLHYEQTTKSFDLCESCLKRLKNHLPSYENTARFFTHPQQDIYLKLRPRLPQAIRHANLCGAFDHEEAAKSVSEMYRFFQSAEVKSSFFA